VAMPVALLASLGGATLIHMWFQAS
jgi:hypothetical protein